MIGAIAGDIIGSVYEARPIKTTTFPLFVAGSRFTDDTVLTVATAMALLEKMDYGRAYRQLARAYPGRGFGAAFAHWFQDDAAAAYNSWGNGAAMRVSPIGWAFDDRARVLGEAQQSAAVTHNPKASAAPRPPRWPSGWRDGAGPRRTSGMRSRNTSTTTSGARSRT